MSKQKDLFGFLGGTTQTKIFSLVLIILLLVGAYFGIRQLVKFFKSKLIQQRQQVSELEMKGVQASYSDAEYAGLANRIYNAMKGLGTDENAVYSVLNQLKNKLDWLKLQIAFGVKDNETLIDWLWGEFSLQSEKSKINSILQSKGCEPVF